MANVARLASLNAVFHSEAKNIDTWLYVPQTGHLTYDIFGGKKTCEERTTGYGARIRCFIPYTVVSQSIYGRYV